MNKLLLAVMALYPIICFPQSDYRQFERKTGILFPVDNCKIEKYGYIDSTGKLVIDFIYGYATEFVNYTAYVRVDSINGSDYVINMKGEKIADRRGRYIEGIAWFTLNNKWGYIDSSAKIIQPPVYDEAYEFCNGLAAVKRNNKWGYIDKKGTVVIPLVYDDYGNYSEGLIAVCQNKKWGYIDITNKVRIPFVYSGAGRFRNQLAPVLKDSLWGFIDQKGRQKIKFQFEDVEGFFENMAAAKRNGKWGFIDTSGILKIPYEYELIFRNGFNKGLAHIQVSRDEKGFGSFISKNNNVVCEDCLLLDYGDGLAPVSKSVNGQKLWGYVDTNGRIIIDFQYKLASKFGSEIGLVQLKNERFMFIDRQNKNIFNKYYTHAGPFANGLGLIQRSNGTYTYIDEEGQEWNTSFDYATSFYEGRAVITMNKINYLIDPDGNILVKSRMDLSGQFMNGLAEASLQIGDLKVNMEDGSLSGDGELYRGYVDRNGREFFYFYKCK